MFLAVDVHTMSWPTKVDLVAQQTLTKDGVTVRNELLYAQVYSWQHFKDRKTLRTRSCRGTVG